MFPPCLVFLLCIVGLHSLQDEDTTLKDLMKQARDLPLSKSSLSKTTFNTNMNPRRQLTQAEIKHFNDEGYVIVRQLFPSSLMDMMRTCVTEDPAVASNVLNRKDLNGLTTKLTLWNYFGDDSFGLIGRSASMVQMAADLMGKSEPFPSHTKILLKEPKTGGAWEWHQDFGYWYNQGLTQPDKIVSAIVAIDENNEQNGAMRLLTKSHRLGKLDHGSYAGQMGADPLRVVQASEIAGYDVIDLLLEPGDVAFTHSNLLHSSRPNLSTSWRRNFIIAYNSKGNEPLESGGTWKGAQPDYTKIKVVSDDEIINKGCVFLDQSRDDFMAQREKEQQKEQQKEL